VRLISIKEFAKETGKPKMLVKSYVKSFGLRPAGVNSFKDFVYDHNALKRIVM
jgi:hypothetical protein